MTTFVVSVDVRVGPGEPAKKEIVGVYLIENPDEFEILVNFIEYGLNLHGWIPPSERVQEIKDQLKVAGYVPIETVSAHILLT